MSNPLLKDILSINRQNSSEPFIKHDTEPSNYFDKFFINLSDTIEIDYELLIKEVNELPFCLNEFLRKKMKTPKERIQLVEIRNKNIKIKLYSTHFNNKKIVICRYCKKHWPNPYTLQEIEINFSETNSNICSCELENHDFYKTQIIFNYLNDEMKREIEDIRKIYEEHTIENPGIIVKGKILNLIKDKDEDTKLKIISSLMNINAIKPFFYTLDYNDEIYSISFSCLKENKKYSSYNNIMYEYMNILFFYAFQNEEIPILVFDYDYHSNLPALYYNNPDFFSHFILLWLFFIGIYI